jgi:hypothetical protein
MARAPTGMIDGPCHTSLARCRSVVDGAGALLGMFRGQVARRRWRDRGAVWVS